MGFLRLVKEDVVASGGQQRRSTYDYVESAFMVGFEWALSGSKVGVSDVSCTEETLHAGEVNTILALQCFTIIRIWLYSIFLVSILLRRASSR